MTAKSYALAMAAMLMVKCANIQKEEINTASPSAGGVNGVSGGNPPAAGTHLADTVIEAPGHTGIGFYDQNKAINGVRGAGSGAGSFDVFSLDNSGPSSHIVLRWNGKKVKNGPGIDFIVFENGFNISENPTTRFMDLVIVEVSNDNLNYCGFAPDYTFSPETVYSNNPQYWQRFAGRTPVLYNQDTNNLDTAQLFQDNDNNYEGDLGGGDAFDLEGLSADNYYATGCNSALREELRTNGFTFIRLTPAHRRINPDTGAVFVKDGISNGPDIDGVVARYAE